MKNINFFVAIIIATFVISCQDENLNKEDLQNEQTLSKNAQETLNYLVGRGYKKDELKPNFKLKSFIHGDMEFSFDMAENLKNSESNSQAKNQWAAGVSVRYAESNNVTYFIESNFPSYYIGALDWASYYWRISSPNIDIRRTFNRSEADIICSAYFDRNDVAYARAQLPQGSGRVGSFLRVNTNFSNESNPRAALVLMMHELGHNLGFEHADKNIGNRIPNTETPDFHFRNGCGSIMRSGVFTCSWDYNNVKNWSQSDINALAWAYRYQ